MDNEKHSGGVIADKYSKKDETVKEAGDDYREEEEEGEEDGEEVKDSENDSADEDEMEEEDSENEYAEKKEKDEQDLEDSKQIIDGLNTDKDIKTNLNSTVKKSFFRQGANFIQK